MRILLLCLGLLAALPLAAHEVRPTIGDLTVGEGEAQLVLRLNAEAFLAGIDLDEVEDTNETAEADRYDALRALDAAALEAAWAETPEVLTPTIEADGAVVPFTFAGIEADPLGDLELPREARVRYVAPLPAGAERVTVGWPDGAGNLVLRQMGVAEESAYTGYVQGGESSGPITPGGGDAQTAMGAFVDYVPVGFDHILPLGLDHILFVLGLFLLSTRLRPLIWQVTAFTLAHTVTLALGALGWVNLPGSVVEPIIAASIAFVAIENLFSDRMSRWRPLIVFGFGLLHGLGFASVLQDFGLPQSQFIPALLGFNVGVELGQLTVIAVAFLIAFAAIRNAAQGHPSTGLAMGYVGFALILVPVATIVLAGASAEMREAYWPLVLAAAILSGFCAVAATSDGVDNYRDSVSKPASVLIALVAVYWVAERVFL